MCILLFKSGIGKSLPQKSNPVAIHRRQNENLLLSSTEVEMKKKKLKTIIIQRLNVATECANTEMLTIESMFGR